MKLTSQLTALREKTRGLTTPERAKYCCDLAKQLEKAGKYDAACEVLSEFWPDRNKFLSLNDRDEATKAILFLRIGALSGWLGSTDQAAGSQGTAKDLITKSIEIFERLGQTREATEAHSDLALCYWREGSYDEARIHLASALSELKDEDSDLKAIVLIRAGIVEAWSHRLNEAMRFYNEAAPLVETSKDHALKGSFHFEYGVLLRRLAAPENREEYLDRALIEYAASGFHYEQAGNERALARVENNLGYLLFTIGKYDKAHKHLDRARHLFLGLNDTGAVAQVDDTRARALLAENRLAEAERVVRYAVRVLQKGDQHALLAEALTTQGVAFARLGDYPSAKRSLQRAIEVAETTGDLEGAGRAKLSIIEELSGQTPAPQLVSIYQSAAELLKQSQDPSTGKRLIACAQKVIEGLRTAEIQGFESEDISWASFKREVRKAEKALLARALRQTEGSVTKASHLLGFKHHQSLISIINIRHKDLLKTRSRIRKRRRHIFSESRKPKQPAEKRINKSTSPIAILHVEDNAQVANLVADMFAGEKWRMESCADGDSALRKLTGKEPYDVLVIDNDLPGLNGLELVQRARNITRRRRTPIIMLSASDCEREAWRAGVNAFLKKPEQIDELPTTVARLLTARSNDL